MTTINNIRHFALSAFVFAMAFALMPAHSMADEQKISKISAFQSFNATLEDILHSDDALFSLGGQDFFYDVEDEKALKMHLEDQWSLELNSGQNKAMAVKGEKWVSDDYYNSLSIGVGLEYEF